MFQSVLLRFLEKQAFCFKPMRDTQPHQSVGTKQGAICATHEFQEMMSLCGGAALHLEHERDAPSKSVLLGQILDWDVS